MGDKFLGELLDFLEVKNANHRSPLLEKKN